MAWESWRTVKRAQCEFVKDEVALESKLIHAADLLPDQPPRVVDYRCSGAEKCNRFDHSDCPLGIPTLLH